MAMFAMTDGKQAILRRRLLQDIAELQARPYPNISLHFQDADFSTACLVLTPSGKRPLHLTVKFGSEYPIAAPKVTIQTAVKHPNVFGEYICATMLNDTEGWTPAYTLKGVALQLLSFFSSEKIEQDHGGDSINLKDYEEYEVNHNFLHSDDMVKYGLEHQCILCGFGRPSSLTSSTSTITPTSMHVKSSTKPSATDDCQIFTKTTNEDVKPDQKQSQTSRKDWIQVALPLKALASSRSAPKRTREDVTSPSIVKKQLTTMPDEILLHLCNELETEELMIFARAWNRIGTIMVQYDLIRTRELQCFCLKNSFTNSRLGIGVNVLLRGRVGNLESEFDLLSLDAFEDFEVRKSVQGVSFKHWMPLPISRRHWNAVKGDAHGYIMKIGVAARIEPCTSINVLYHFMSDVVVKLSQEASKHTEHLPYSARTESLEATKSTLKHASEKAIEAYFSLWHLLLCLATAAPAVVRSANATINNFLAGKNNKESCPSLGHLLIAILISDAELDDILTTAIIKEAIIRNVVWMLDRRGAGLWELAYMEPSAISEYRIAKTFEASKTSYRLLMFLNLFRRTTQPPKQEKKSLEQLRDDLFNAHGAPPKGSATKLANDIKKIQEVNTFSDFFAFMDIKNPPSKSELTSFLRRSVEDSMKKGYSIWGMSQNMALQKRREKEPTVEVNQNPKPEWKAVGTVGTGSFFPNKGRK